MVRQGSLIWLVAVAGCFPQGSTSELDALREEVEALRAEVDSLKEDKADAARLAAVEAYLGDDPETIDDVELSALNGYATDAELAEGLAGKADASALDGYATDGELADGLAGKADTTTLADLDARVSALESVGGGCACETTGIEGRLVEVERNLGDVEGTPEIELVRVDDLTERVAAVELYLGDDPATPDAVEPFSAIEEGDAAALIWVEGQGYALAADVSAEIAAGDQAVKDWVGLQGYLTSVPGGPYATMVQVDDAIDAALVGYATVTQMEAGDDAVEAWVAGQGYLTSAVGGVTLTDVDTAIDAALVGYATESWVSQLNFATTTYVDAGDAAERQWVVDQGYSTGGVGAFATQSYVDAAIADEVQRVNGMGYAQQSWVTSYVDAGDAAERAWVLAQGYASTAALSLEAAALRAEIAAGDSAERSWVEAQGFVPNATLANAVVTYDPANRPEDDGVLEVPGDFADIHEALAFLAPKRLMSGVEIRVMPDHCGTVYDKTIYLEHPDGGYISVVGQGGAGACPLYFDLDGGSGLSVPSGYWVGKVEGLALECVDGANCSIGVLVEANAVARLIDVTASGFGNAGFRTEFGGVLETESVSAHENTIGLVASLGGVWWDQNGASDMSDNSYSGVTAADGAVVYASNLLANNSGIGVVGTNGAVVNLAGLAADGGGTGVLLNGGAVGYLGGARLSGNSYAGVSMRQATADLRDATIDNNGSVGVLTEAASSIYGVGMTVANTDVHGWQIGGGSHLTANDSFALDNGGRGFHIHNGSTAILDGSRASGNGDAGFGVDGGAYLQGDVMSSVNNALGLLVSSGSAAVTPGLEVACAAYAPGVRLFGGSFSDLSYATSSGCSTAFRADYGSFMFAKGVEAVDFSQFGFLVDKYAGIWLGGAFGESSLSTTTALAVNSGWMATPNATLSGDVVPAPGTSTASPDLSVNSIVP